MNSSIPLLKSEISGLYLSSVATQAGLCRTWSETPKTGFLASRLIYELFHEKKNIYSFYMFKNNGTNQLQGLCAY